MNWPFHVFRGCSFALFDFDFGFDFALFVFDLGFAFALGLGFLAART